MTSIANGLEARCQQRIDALKANNRYRKARIAQTRNDGRCEIDGQIVLNFGGNDYLNLAHELTGSLHGITAKLPMGATASPIVIGRSPSLAALEKEIAEFEETDAALVFPSGFAANFGLLTGLTTDKDAIFCDRDTHASVIDAVRFSAAKQLVYRRDRLDRLKTALQRRRTHFDQVIIVTDGVYSMDGQTAPLPELCQIANDYNATVIVDEAHATGVLGKTGQGTAEFLNVHKQVPIRSGTLSKAIGCLGGFVCGPSPVIDLLRHAARSQFFSTGLPPIICEAARKAINVIKTQPHRRARLHQLTKRTLEMIGNAGLTIPPAVNAPIIPLLIGNDHTCMQASQQLFEKGIFAPAIRPPTVPDGTARLRISLSIAHKETDIQRLVTEIQTAIQK